MIITSAIKCQYMAGIRTKPERNEDGIMKIEWNIKKEQGNLRPKLYYWLALEPFEIKLGVPMVQVISTIPKPPDAWESHAYPKQKERGDWTPGMFYNLCSPSHKTGFSEVMVRLPMRENCQYPEVEESFLLLRKEYEKCLKEAYHNAAFEIRGSLDISRETKKQIAPGFVAAKMLKLARNAA